MLTLFLRKMELEQNKHQRRQKRIGQKMSINFSLSKKLNLTRFLELNYWEHESQPRRKDFSIENDVLYRIWSIKFVS